MAAARAAQRRPRRGARAPMPAPLRGLQERLASDAGGPCPEWARWLPPRLRPAALPPVAAAAGVSTAEAAADGEDCPALVGNVWRRAQQAAGCREVQNALEDAEGDWEREALVAELRGHAAEAARCPHANHVLQKAVECLPPRAVQFVVDELRRASIVQMAKHKYGCRVVQRLIEHCYEEQVEPMLDELLKDIGALSRHPYGNYVVQVVLQHGGEAHRRKIARSLRKELRVLGAEPTGCAVIAAALQYADADDQLQLTQALVKEPGLVVFMASVRHGDIAVTRLLSMLSGAELDTATSRLAGDLPSLRATKYGRQVASFLEGAGVVDKSATVAGA